MQTAERGPRSVGWGIALSIVALIGLACAAAGAATTAWVLVVIGLLVAALCGIRAYGAFTGVKRVRRTA